MESDKNQDLQIAAANNLKNLKRQRDETKKLLEKDKDLSSNTVTSLNETLTILDQLIPAMDKIIKNLIEINGIILEPVKKSLENNSSESINRITAEISSRFKASNRIAKVFGFVGIIAVVLAIIQFNPWPVLKNFKFQRVFPTNKNELHQIVDQIEGSNIDFENEFITFKKDVFDFSLKCGSENWVSEYDHCANKRREIADKYGQRDLTQYQKSTFKWLSYNLEYAKIICTGSLTQKKDLLKNINIELQSSSNLTSEFKYSFMWLKAELLNETGDIAEANTVYGEIKKSNLNNDVIDIKGKMILPLNVVVDQRIDYYYKDYLPKNEKRIFLLNSSMDKSRKIAIPAKNLLIDHGYNASNIFAENFEDECSSVFAYYKNSEDYEALVNILEILYPKVHIKYMNLTVSSNISNANIRERYYRQGSSKNADFVIRMPVPPGEVF